MLTHAYPKEKCLEKIHKLIDWYWDQKCGLKIELDETAEEEIPQPKNNHKEGEVVFNEKVHEEVTETASI